MNEIEYHKQAVIITAYHNFNQLAVLANMLSKVFEVYIHIDKRVSIEEWKYSNLRCAKHIKVFSLYNVNWGGCNHLKAILHLMDIALKNKDIMYFHIISGEDWPTKNVKEIYNRFIAEDKIYLEVRRMDEMKKMECLYISKWQKYYSFLDVFDYKKIPQKIFVKGLVFFQRIVGIDRFKKLDIELARGVIWGELPRNAVSYCLEYLYENPQFMNFLEYGHASEEFFFHSILSNSAEWKRKIANNNLRYVEYERRNGSYPAILDMKDFEKIKTGNYYFARKITMPISEDLVVALNEQNGN